MSDDDGPSQPGDSDPYKLAEPTDMSSATPVQETAENSSGEDLKGELNELAPVTDTPESAQERATEPGSGDGE